MACVGRGLREFAQPKSAERWRAERRVMMRAWAPTPRAPSYSSMPARHWSQPARIGRSPPVAPGYPRSTADHLRCAMVAVIGGKKQHRVVGEPMRVVHALLRHFDDALGNHFPHCAGISGPGNPAAGFFNPIPRIVQGRDQHFNALRIEDRCRLDRCGDFDRCSRSHVRTFIWKDRFERTTRARYSMPRAS